MEFLTKISLIPARVAMELVDTSLEIGMVLWSAVSIFFL